MLMNWMVKALQGSPELAMFLAVGIGYWVGGIQLGKFSLGTVTAALIAALAIGQLHVEVSRELRWGLFLLFLFANGYSAGPQFFQAIKENGVKPMLLSVVVTVVGLGTAWAAARLFRLDAGTAAGIFCGGLTQSAAIGTATDAVMNLPLPLAERKLMADHIAVADALTYLFGAIGMILFVSSWGPRLLRIDLREEAAALERKFGIQRETAGVFTAHQKFAVRSYRLSGGEFAGKRVDEAERCETPMRYFVEHILRGGNAVEVRPETVLQAGDTVTLYGQMPALVKIGPRMGTELHEPGLLQFSIEILKVTVTNKAMCGIALKALMQAPEFDFRGVGLRSVTRGTQPIPIGTETVLDRGDVLELIGPQRAVERVAAHIGHALRPTGATSLSMLGLGILCGALIGLPYVVVGNVRITLSVSVGTLVAGLVLGWLRSLRPTLGDIPQPALDFMINFGLAAFVACSGLQAGPEFVHAVKELGFGILLAGAAVTLLPQAAALLVGHYVLRMNPLMLLGGLAGAQTFTAALAAVQEKAGSRIPVLGYTVPYATSNILLTTGGSIMVALMAY
ncbi:aspartate-alanine antiporter [Paraburkholderia sp. FT54]|uniref:aspartate-alanine antiporter n=1 Tax=Paraburkholderia sp. FT54 TaxID=3074437 RepID=UPI002877F68F|nr:aspartate-alanine antiporter [Paraburkholderia sp. FT54]WNC94160.1 aspartate-alanine antiporter [Paraburkholderia sp. FT54]